MNPPATIQVLQHSFELQFADETFFNSANAFGYCDKVGLVIRVYRKMKPTLLAEVVIHEILHAIHFSIGADEELNEEQLAQHFAGPLVMVIRDNPLLVAWLQSLLNPGRS